MIPPSAGRVVDTVRHRVPAAAIGHVARVFAELDVDVRIVPPRRTRLGDHRPPAAPRLPHRITLNADLNPWAFLTTLLHEAAHAATWERHAGRRRRVRPHGPEWQREFARMLAPLVGGRVFPVDVAAAVSRWLEKPPAATCGDRGLVLALARHDPHRPRRVRVEDLAEGDWFRVDGGHVFRAGRLLRTRRRCRAAVNGGEYRVHGLLLVEPLPDGP